MFKKVLATIEKYGMLTHSRKITVALSGGADSVTLLYVLLRLKEQLGIELRAAHLNHQLRNEESERDEAFVKRLCEELNIPLIVEKADINAQCKKTGESTELAARKIRYAFFERVAEGGLIATAHTASDSAETVLFNLSRGTALKGLTGIPAVRGIFIRPLISVTRAEVEQYCKEQNINFVDDSTNFTDDYTRNKIRHNVIPVLKEFNSSLENTLSRTACILSEDNDCLDGLARELYNRVKSENGIKTAELSGVHPAIAKRVIAFFLNDIGIDAMSVNIEGVLAILNGGKVIMPNAVALKSQKGTLFIEKETAPAEFTTEYSVVDREEFEKLKKVNSLLLKNTLDYDKIIGEFCIRPKLSGDKMRISGRGVTKTLKKLCTENAVDLTLRDNLPVAADEQGVIWGYGFGVSERVEVDSSTKNFLILKSELKN